MTQIRCYRKYCLYRKPFNKETFEDNTYGTCTLRDIVVGNNGKCADYDSDNSIHRKSYLHVRAYRQLKK